MAVAILIAVFSGLAYRLKSNERENRHRFHGGGAMDANRSFSTVRRAQANGMGLVAAPAFVHQRPTRTPHFLFNPLLHDLHELAHDIDRSRMEYE